MTVAVEYAHAYPWRGRPYPTRSRVQVTDDYVLYDYVLGTDYVFGPG